MVFDQFLKAEYLLWLWHGFLTMLQVVALVIPLSTILGLVLATLNGSSWRIVSWSASVWIRLFRNSPLLVQLFFWYFGASAFLSEEARVWLNSSHTLFRLARLEVDFPSYEFVAGVCGLSLYSAAYVAEEIRAGLLGVSRGQLQAAEALGMRSPQIYRYILLPQAIRIALGPLMGQYMNIVKNSSLTMAIGVAELSYAARQVETVSFKTFQAFGVATLLYVVTIAFIESLTRTLQVKYPTFGGEGK